MLLSPTYFLQGPVNLNLVSFCVISPVFEEVLLGCFLPVLLIPMKNVFSSLKLQSAAHAEVLEDEQLHIEESKDMERKPQLCQSAYQITHCAVLFHRIQDAFLFWKWRLVQLHCTKSNLGLNLYTLGLLIKLFYRNVIFPHMKNSHWIYAHRPVSLKPLCLFDKTVAKDPE